MPKISEGVVQTKTFSVGPGVKHGNWVWSMQMSMAGNNEVNYRRLTVITVVS